MSDERDDSKDTGHRDLLADLIGLLADIDRIMAPHKRRRGAPYRVDPVPPPPLPPTGPIGADTPDRSAPMGIESWRSSGRAPPQVPPTTRRMRTADTDAAMPPPRNPPAPPQAASEPPRRRTVAPAEAQTHAPRKPGPAMPDDPRQTMPMAAPSAPEAPVPRPDRPAPLPQDATAPLARAIVPALPPDAGGAKSVPVTPADGVGQGRVRPPPPPARAETAALLPDAPPQLPVASDFAVPGPFRPRQTGPTAPPDVANVPTFGPPPAADASPPPDGVDAQRPDVLPEPEAQSPGKPKRRRKTARGPVHMTEAEQRRVDRRLRGNYLDRTLRRLT